MARIELDQLDEMEILLIGILSHFDQIPLSALSWLATRMPKDQADPYAPHAARFLAGYPGLLGNMSANNPHVVNTLALMEGNKLVIIDGKGDNYIHQLKQEKLPSLVIKLTQSGKQFAEAIRARRFALQYQPDPRKVFVASSFNNSDVNSLIDSEIKPACSKLGLNAVVGNELIKQGLIQRSLEEEISTSVAMIADLTDARPSVYFEVGLADALGMPLLLYCRNDHKSANKMKKVHFDLAHYIVGFWGKNGDQIQWERSDLSPLNYLKLKVIDAQADSTPR